jgi:hypothetical protein
VLGREGVESRRGSDDEDGGKLAVLQAATFELCDLFMLGFRVLVQVTRLRWPAASKPSA